MPIDTFCDADYYYIDDVLLAVSVSSGATRMQDIAGGVMTEDKVVALLARFSEDLPSGSAFAVGNALRTAPDNMFDYLITLPVKSAGITVVLSIFLGGLGIDRFYVGDIGLGIAKLLFGWLTLGLWPLIDIFLCYKKARQVNMEAIMTAISAPAGYAY